MPVFLLFSVDCELWMADFFHLYWYFCSCDWFLSFVLCCVMLVGGLGFSFGAGLDTLRCSIIFVDLLGGNGDVCGFGGLVTSGLVTSSIVYMNSVNRYRSR